MAPRKKAQRVEKAKGIPYVVVDQGNHSRLKYLPKLGEPVTGFSQDQAERLALPAHESHTWTAISLEAFHEHVEALNAL